MRKSLETSKKFTFGALLLLAILVVFSPFTMNYFNLGEDTAFYLLRIEELKEGFFKEFSFFKDLFLLIPAILRRIGFSIMAAYKVYVFLIIAATILSAYYSLKLCTKNENIALFGSLLYILNPYYIYNIYNRGAIYKCIVMVFLPLVIAGIYGIFVRYIHNKKNNADIIGKPSILKWSKSEKHLIFRGTLYVILILVCGVAIYQVDDIAYNMEVVRLYDIENLESINDAGGESILDDATSSAKNGSEIGIWLGRTEEVKNGILQNRLILFPTFDGLNTYGGFVHALDSNLWLLFPALISVAGGSLEVVYHIYFFLMHILTLCMVIGMFRMLFQEKFTVVFGTIFYMTCPYRIYLCLDVADLGRVAVWMLIPALIWGLAGLYRYGLKLKINHLKYLILSGMALAGIGYADSVMFFIILCMVLISGLWYWKGSAIFVVAIGTILFLPGLLYLARYLFTGEMDTWGMPLGDISVNGYHFGQFFSSYAYKEGVPGMGLALLGGLLIFAWLHLTQPAFQGKKMGFYLTTSGVLCLISLAKFPWALVQRLGTPFLKLIPLIETPAVFFGLANIFFCILAAYAIQEVTKEENIFVRVGFPIMSGIAAIVVCVYLIIYR